MKGENVKKDECKIRDENGREKGKNQGLEVVIDDGDDRNEKQKVKKHPENTLTPKENEDTTGRKWETDASLTAACCPSFVFVDCVGGTEGGTGRRGGEERRRKERDSGRGRERKNGSQYSGSGISFLYTFFFLSVIQVFWFIPFRCSRIS